MARNCDQIATMRRGTGRDGCPTPTGGMAVELGRQGRGGDKHHQRPHGAEITGSARAIWIRGRGVGTRHRDLAVSAAEELLRVGWRPWKMRWNPATDALAVLAERAGAGAVPAAW